LQKCLEIAQRPCNTPPGEVASTPRLHRGTSEGNQCVTPFVIRSGCAEHSPIAHLASTSERADDTIADGYISDSAPVSIFDENLPAISNLEPDLRAAVQAATTAAGNDGQDIVITSGWRSAAYQQSLLDEATAKYGSYDEARKWVNTPELSAHVYGDAVDIGPLDAQFWLIEHGSDYGLCQTYTNERWHFELSTEPGGTCPVQRSDAAG
jgi:D-alanyl-D-alanine carboxypeptidase